MSVNRELLLKVKEKILAEPAQFEMESLFKHQEVFDNQGEATPFWTPVDVKREVPNCGTAACIAGWAIAIDFGGNPDKAFEKFEQLLDFKPSDLLGLGPTGDGEETSPWNGTPRFDSLCYVGGWPDEQRDAWRATEDLHERAKIAAEVIDLRLAEWAAEDATTEEGK